jgi:hypothetical protein
MLDYFYTELDEFKTVAEFLVTSSHKMHMRIGKSKHS